MTTPAPTRAPAFNPRQLSTDGLALLLRTTAQDAETYPALVAEQARRAEILRRIHDRKAFAA